MAGLPIITVGEKRYADVGAPTLIPIDFDEPPKVEHDGYPDVIADARHAYKVETVEDLEDFWLRTLERPGVEMHWSEIEVVPYINRARWLVDCPECNSGNYVWDRSLLACCLDCGLMVKVAWQSPFVRSAAIRLLAVRPVVNCNWNAHKGETVEQLEVENRWLLDEPSVEKNGLIVPKGLDVPDALAKYIDPEVG